MIKARELRIGNLIMLETDNFDFKDTIFRLNNVGQYRCTMSEINKSAFITKNTKFLKPIPLTRERLDDFGFDTFQYGGQGNVTNTGTLKDIEVCLIHNTIYRGGYRAINYKLEYVHQLQNFYFATENEELKIK